MSTPRWLRWRDWSLTAKSAAALAMPLTLLVFALGFNYRLQRDITAADANVRRALAIQAEIQTLHSLIAESATGVRGYLLTGREEFLAPYRAAREALPATRAALRSNIRDPEMKQRLERIEGLLDQKLDSLDALRDTGRSLGADDLQAHLLGSKALLDAMRAEIRAMYAREAALVGQYSDAARHALQRNLWVDVITSVLVLVTGVAAFALLFGGVVSRVKRLVVNAERLAQGAPLQALPTGRDELGLLAERLQNTSLLLAERAGQAQAASRAKTDFLSRTSHELRTPLNAILGFAQLLETDLKGSTSAASVAQVLTAGRHLLALIDEVLDIARIESGEMQMQMQALRMAPLLHEVQSLIAPQAAQHQVRIEAAAASDVTVLADTQRLRQVLLNVLSNAVKFNQPSGLVQLSLRQQDNVVFIDIRDTGRGIAADLLPRLFAPFERLDANQLGVDGTGLGLAISRQLMQRMGGDMTVQSQPGQGSTFTLRLNTAVEGLSTRPVIEPQLPVPAPAAPAMRQLLCIEDQRSNIALIQAVLARRPHWQLCVAMTAEAGLRMATAHRPDLILLDLHLPDLSGEHVLAQLQAEPVLQGLVIAVLSADAQPETRQRLLAAGAADYLTKPLEIPRLLALLDRTTP